MNKPVMKMAWDGEKIKISTIVEDEKVSPKEFMDGLNNARNQLNQALEQKTQAEAQVKQMDEAIESIKSFLNEREEYADKCNELMIEKLKCYIAALTPELVKKAEVEAKKIIDRDPNALDEKQKIGQKYVIYQKELATNPKVAKNISQDIIRDNLFDKPIFENPFALD